MSERDLVFFSYRHDVDGKRWLSAIQSTLKPYVLGQRPIAWSDRDIRTGEQWDARIQEAIDRSRVAVLLINQRFFSSAYIRQHELPRLVADAREGKLKLVCVLIGFDDPALRAEHGLADFQFGHDPATPLNALRGARLDKTLVQLAMKVRDAYGTPDLSVSPPHAATAGRQGEAAQAVSPASAGETPGPLGALLDVPPLNPAHHVARTAELNAIRDQLLGGTDLAHGLTSAAPGLGLYGMGGMGKSVMAQALCHDEDLRRAFPDGVAWVALGQQPDLLALQNRLLRLLDPRSPPADSQADARAQLQARLDGRRALIVVDDIWDARHFRAFDVVRGRSRLLMTTRDASVLSHVGAQAHALQRLPGPLARELLALRSGCRAAELPPEADEVVEHTGGLPLALALAGAQVADGVSWPTLAQQLRAGRIEFLDHAYGSVYDTLGRSVDALPANERERYLELAVFPEDTAVPASVVARLWQHSGGLGAAESEKLLARFDRKALLTVSGVGVGREVALHDLQHDFLRWRADDMAALHGRLLDASRTSLTLPDGAAGWARLPPDEPYLWGRLAQHLAAAGREQELDAALLHRDWIEARLAAATRSVDGRHITDVAALRNDYALAPAGSAARRVGRALSASAHVLRHHPQAIDQQLFGRLGRCEQPSLQTLALVSLAALEHHELLIPTRPSLAPPGALDATMVGHLEWVRGVLLLPDGRRALSWSDDRTLRLWDLRTERQLGCYFADAAVTAVTLQPRTGRVFVGDALGNVQILRIA